MAIKQTYWKDTIIELLLKRDKYICKLCDGPFLENDLYEIDHIIEKKFGGDDSIDNLRVVHVSCHKLRHHPERKRITRKSIQRGGHNLSGTLEEVVDRFSKLAISIALERNKHNITKAAEQLGLSRPTLYEKMKRYGMQK